MFWKNNSTTTTTTTTSLPKEKDTKNLKENQQSDDEKKSESSFKLFSCDHYQHELNDCRSFRSKVNRYYRGESDMIGSGSEKKNNLDCNYYEDLFASCIDYYKDPKSNFYSLKK